jgi:Sperm-tail PG-rich repeat
LKTDFEKANEKPKFHMGIKTGARSNKNLDMPGPGEYETDVIPMHHSNAAHVIGTGIRSDLGVGKAHLAPGPGEYENRPRNDSTHIG